MNIAQVDYDGLIPNNVALGQDVRVKRALEKWHPGYLNWWNDMGPEGFQDSLVYLRTAVSVDPKGWAKFDYVRMPEYRWGVLLAPQMEGRKVNFGMHKGEDAWQEVPGEYRAMLRRLVVIQGDTEPASVEQQRYLGKTAPSLYDMRNLFQVNVEEGRHLWAMVYLMAARRRKPCCSAARAIPTRRACWAPSTRRRPTGSRSSCSPISPTATARCSSRRWRNRASTRCRALAASCSPKRRTICSSAKPASPASSSAPARR
jgi:benzoyl-CoA oxygenase B subunit